MDEYGGTSGLITLEDIVEEIIGDISDEYDDEEALYTKIDDHTFIFEAKIQLNDFFKIGEIDEDDFIDAEATEEVETLAGFILELKGEIPRKNEQIEFGKSICLKCYQLTIAESKVKLIIKEEQEDEEA